jgi:hypothetical protein
MTAGMTGVEGSRTIKRRVKKSAVAETDKEG